MKFVQYLLLFLLLGNTAIAQTNSSATADSIKLAIKAKRATDSIARYNQKQLLLQQRASRDSATAVAKDSMKNLIAKRREALDSTIQARKAIRDSATAARQIIKDSIQNERESKAKYLKLTAKDKDKSKTKGNSKNNSQSSKQQEFAKANAADSVKYTRLMAIEKLKEDRKDSLDKVAKTRKEQNELVTKARKNTADSLANARKIASDKLKAERKLKNDALAIKRKAQSDTLLERKKLKLALQIKLYKTPEEKQMAAAMKQHQKKQAEWNNQKLLKKPWSMQRRIYQNTISRYNYFFNAQNKYNAAVKQLTTSNKDDYASTLRLLPYDINKAGNTVSGDMDSVIKKCAMDVQIHDPRTKWADNLFMLMGKAYFLKNDMDNAIATFQYISNEYKDKPNAKKKPQPKTKTTVKTPADYSISTIENRKGIHALSHQPIRNDALLWLAKCYIQNEAYTDAQSYLFILQSDKNFPKRLQGELDLLSAQVFIANNNTPDAIKALNKAIEDKSISSVYKTRALYLLAQLQSTTKDYEKANANFEKVIATHPVLDMDFYSKLNIAKNAALSNSQNMDDVEHTFNKIINDGKYIAYLDKAYLTLAQLTADKNPEKAIEYLQKSINKNKTDVDTKMNAYTALADIYYKQAQYKNAKLYYDSALNNTQNPNTDKALEMANRRNVLNDLVKELDIISLNDSLLALSKMTKKEQLAIAKKAWNASKKAAEKPVADNTILKVENATTQDDNGWYFNNTAMIESGVMEFKRTWGNRANVDNWRRNGTTTDNENANETDTTAPTNMADAVEESKDSKNAELKKYVDKIPTTDAQVKLCNESIMNSLYNASVIYFAGLNDNAKTIEFLNRLLTQYPATTYKAQALYSMYLAQNKVPNTAEANKYLQLLQTEFPDSKLTELAKNPNAVKEKEQQQNTAVAYYNDTYDLYKDNKFGEVKNRILFAKENYPTSVLKPKFELLSALTNVQQKNIKDGKAELEKIVQSYAGKEEATMAQDVLFLIAKNDTSIKTNNTQNVPSYQQKTNNYVYDPNEEHYFLFVLHTINDKLSPMKSGFSDYNSMKHSLDNLESTLYLVDENSGTLVFKTFANEAKAKKYLLEIANQKTIYSAYKNNEYELAIISKTNYDYFKGTRDLQGYLKFYKKNYK